MYMTLTLRTRVRLSILSVGALTELSANRITLDVMGKDKSGKAVPGLQAEACLAMLAILAGFAITLIYVMPAGGGALWTPQPVDFSPVNSHRTGKLLRRRCRFD